MRYDLYESKWFNFIQRAVDIAIVLLGYRLAFFIRFGDGLDRRNIDPFYRIIPFIVVASIFFFHIYLSGESKSKSYFDRVLASFLSIAMIQFSTVTISFFVRAFAFPRSVILISALLQCMAMLAWKRAIISICKRFCKPNRMLIVGGTDANRRAAKKMLGFNRKSIEVACESKGLQDLDEAVMDSIDSLCLTSDIKGIQREKLIEYAVSKDKALYIIPDFHEIVLKNTVWSHFDDIPVLKARKPSMTLEQRIYKRAFDLFFAVPLLALSLPLMAIIAAAIKLQDKGPAIYRQERLTTGGESFKLMKFRTMVVGAETESGPVLSPMQDDRITRIGRLLRSTRLDELPQLFNVVRGDLSLVGPRPERAFFYEKYESELPQFKYRLSVKAGITGMGQILGKYTTSPADKLIYDMLYIYSYSMLSDVKIILETLAMLFKADSAQGAAGPSKAMPAAKESCRGIDEGKP